MTTAIESPVTEARPAEQALRGLLAPIVDDHDGEPRRRIERAEADLRACLGVNGGGDAPAAMLLGVLPSFLLQPEWRGQDEEDRRVRMRLVLELARQIRRLPMPEADLVAASADIERAWGSALRELREAEAASGA